jgi:ABC-type polysaccharide/polyol phosphate transport system ATPase subunit
MEAETKSATAPGGGEASGAGARTSRREQLAGAGTAISVRDLNKTFLMPGHRPATLKERALHPFRRIPKTEVPAARGISFEVANGEFFGIVGRNGSGKSTLLKLLSGVYRPDSGEIVAPGRISPLIELGVGFNMELPAKDNVVINATLLGLTRAEALKRFDEIVEFAGLEEFTELKLKNYSSGMLVRLAFSTAVQVDADIVLLDEVLAVGDAGFQEKCFEVFRQMKREGRTIVLVTHAMDAVRRFCDRAILLDEGRIVASGDPTEVAERYREAATGEQQVSAPSAEQTETSRHGDGAARIGSIWVEQGGERTQVLRRREPLSVCFEVEFTKAMPSPVLGLEILAESGALAFSSNTLRLDLDAPDFQVPDFEAGEHALIRVELENQFGVGNYTLTPGVAHQDGIHMADLRRDFGSFSIDGEMWSGAVADPPHAFKVEREAR